MKKRLIFITLIVGLLFISIKELFSEDGFEQKTDKDTEVREWLKRTEVSIQAETDVKPRVYIETVQPIYQDFDKINTLFTQGRLSMQDERATYNLGFGYRKLMFDDRLLGGINSFFDYEDLHEHSRAGIGLEALTRYIEARINSYFGLSSKRLVEETSTTYTYEKAVDGMDVELGGPLPYLPWMKIFGSYYYYDFEKFKDMEGYKIRSEISPWECLRIDLETWDDNKGDSEQRVTFAFKLKPADFRAKSIAAAFKPFRKAYPERDLRDETLKRVVRSFNITVEKWIENKTGGVSVEIGRQ